MKKNLLLFALLFALMGVEVKAEGGLPQISLTVDVDGAERALTFSATEQNLKLQIDWGDGVLVDTDTITYVGFDQTSKVTGTPKGEGQIKIYGKGIATFGCNSRVGGPMVRAIDVSNAPDLVELTVNTNELQALDVTKNVKLEKLTCYSNKGITELDVTKNVNLVRLNANDLNLSNLNLSNNAKLEYLSVNNNTEMKTLDITSCPALVSLYALNIGLTSIDLSHNPALDYVSLNNNQLTSVDVTACPVIRYLMVMNNELKGADDVKFPATLSKSLNVSGNYYNFATLPVAKGVGTYTYTPQEPVEIASTVAVGESVDLAYLDNIQGLADAPQKTVYYWFTDKGDTLKAGVDYEEKDGVFTFLAEQDTTVHCEMTTPAYPEFGKKGRWSTKARLMTTSMRVGNFPRIVLTVDVDEAERELTFSATEQNLKFQIDWGDGVLVETDTITYVGFDQTSKVLGTPKGDGQIKIYGRGIATFGCNSRVTGPQVRAIDVSNAPDLVELTVNTNELQALNVSKNVKLEKLTCYSNKGITELDVTKNVNLVRLNANDLNLSNLNLSNNAKLEYLSVNNNTEMKALDITSCPALVSLYALNIGLTSIDLSHNPALDYVSLNNNQLTSVDVTACPVIRYLMVMNNELKGADDVKFPATLSKSLNVSGNYYNFATLPVAKGVGTYTYTPQKPVKISSTVAVGESLDLAYLDNIQGLADAPQKTVYYWFTDKGDTLKAGVDYEEKDGVFTFLAEQDTTVHCEMTTPAYPEFGKKGRWSTKARLITTSVTICKRPQIALKVDVVEAERELTFSATEQNLKLQIDWGDGVLVETDTITYVGFNQTSTVLGTPKDEGRIRIYGEGIATFGCNSRVTGPQVRAIDVSNAPDLVELTVNTNELQALDVTKNVKLEKLTCYSNKGIKELDVTKNVNLTRLNANDLSLSALDLSNNAKLEYLSVNNNTEMKTLDITSCPALETLYALNIGLTSIDLSHSPALDYVSLNNNQLTSVDATACPAIRYLMVMNNELKSADDVKYPTTLSKGLNVSGNYYNFATLPVAKGVGTYTYTPQKPVEIASTVAVGESVDLAYLDNIQGLADAPQKTVYYWFTDKGDTLKAGVDYEEKDGVFTFLAEQDTTVHCEMTTPAYPEFGKKGRWSTKARLITTSMIVTIGSAEPSLAIQLTADVDGADREFVFSATKPGVKLLIDWGDGKLIETDTIAVADEYGTNTSVFGKPVNKGEIKIYGDGIAAFGCNSTSKGPKVTSLDVTGAVDLKELIVNMNALTSLDVTKNANLTKLVCNNNPGITSLDLTNNTQLVRLDASNMSLSSIDVTKCTALDYMMLSKNKEFASIDLSQNLLLDEVYLIGLGLENVDLSHNVNLTKASLNENNLTSLDASMCEKLDFLFCMNNQLSEIKLPKTLGRTLNIRYNHFTFATLPITGVSNYLYEYQEPVAIDSCIQVGQAVDLSAQDNIQGLADAPQKTAYKWMLSDGTELQEGVDYTVAEGVFTFIKAQEDAVYCKMTSEAFPKLSGVLALTTTEMRVEGETGIYDVEQMAGVSAGKGAVVLSGLKEGDVVSIVTVAGQQVANSVANAPVKRVALPAGAYIVRIQGNVYKVYVK